MIKDKVVQIIFASGFGLFFALYIVPTIHEKHKEMESKPNPGTIGNPYEGKMEYYIVDGRLIECLVGYNSRSCNWEKYNNE